MNMYQYICECLWWFTSLSVNTCNGVPVKCLWWCMSVFVNIYDDLPVYLWIFMMMYQSICECLLWCTSLFVNVCDDVTVYLWMFVMMSQSICECLYVFLINKKQSQRYHFPPNTKWSPRSSASQTVRMALLIHTYHSLNEFQLMFQFVVATGDVLYIKRCSDWWTSNIKMW